MITRTHSTTSVADTDESHVHVAVAFILGISLINTGVVASMYLSCVVGAVLNLDNS